MPTRMVRDGLLESEAVLSLPPEGRWLYVSILLTADDYGLFEATTFKLAKKADIKREHVPALLQMMVDSDLVRLYQPDPTSMRVFGLVTKFRQRMRGYRAKHPLPEKALVSDEPVILNLINELASKKTGDSPPTVSHRRPETRGERREEREERQEEPSALVVEAKAPTTRTGISACPTDEIVALWHQHCAPPLATVGVLNDARRKALSVRWREVCAASGFDRSAGLEWFRWLFAERVASSPFLMGRTKFGDHSRSWRATWDWLMKPTNFAKVVDGNYIETRGVE